jgi:hypothetical protein
VATSGGPFQSTGQIYRTVLSIALRARVCKPRELSVDIVPDIDTLLWHFARPLPADRREEFYRAAEGVLTRLRCPGPGLVHRTLAELLSSYFIPIPTVAIGAEARTGVRATRRRRT